MCDTTNAVQRKIFTFPLYIEDYSIKDKSLKANEIILQFRRLRNTL